MAQQKEKGKGFHFGTATLFAPYIPHLEGRGFTVRLVNGVPVQASQLSRDIDTTAGPRVCVVATTTQQTTHQILPRQKEKPPKGWPHWTCKAGLLISGIIDYLRVQGDTRVPGSTAIAANDYLRVQGGHPWRQRHCTTSQQHVRNDDFWWVSVG